MSLLWKNRVLPACLAAGTIFWVLPALADSPASPPASEIHWQKLVLQHVVPDDILKALSWEHGTNLPAGVTRIYGLTRDNSLFVEATPGGFARLQEIVKTVDVAQRQVLIRVALAQASAADLDVSGIKFDSFPSPVSPLTTMSDAVGPDVSRFAQTLKSQGNVLQSSNITTTSNVQASIGISGQPIASLPLIEAVDFGVTPHINSDGSISLVLHPKATWRVAGKTNPDGTAVTETQDFQTLCTVKNGETWVVTNLFPGGAGSDGRRLLLFVTPVVVGGDRRQ